MSTPINTTVNSKFTSISQPEELFTGITSLEDGVHKLLGLSTESQKHLITFINDIISEVKKNNIQATYYDPGIKAFESALRKAKKGYGTPNQIRLLTDTYRASVIIETLEGIKKAKEFVDSNSEKYGFTIVFSNNTFEKPWPGGYRDINYRLRDTKNEGLIGELQIQLCAVKKFSQIVGHKSYEITRALGPEQSGIKSALETLTRHGYDTVTHNPNSGCILDITKLKGGRRKTYKKRRGI